MPNYKNEISSFRCGDLFKISGFTEIYILSQVEGHLAKLIGLCDKSNRLHDKTEPVKDLEAISKQELLNIIGDDDLNYECIGNIKEYNIIKK